MIRLTTHRRSGLTTAVGAMLIGEAVIFLLAALVHLGVQIPIGVTILAEPKIVDAAIVEGLSGLFLMGSAYAVMTRRGWAWPAATAAQTVSLGGILLGMAALNADLGPSTAANELYHRAMLLVLVAGLSLLLTLRVRTALSGNDQLVRPHIERCFHSIRE